MRESGETIFFFVRPGADLEREDYRAALKHTNTRRIFRRILHAGNALGASKAEGEGNTEFNEGIRALALWLAGKIESAEPGETAALLRESCEERLAWKAMRGKEAK